MNITVSPSNHISARIKLPASKSISNRMLVLRELSANKICLHNISDCDDTFVMQRALQERNNVTDIMAAGTAMRFLTAYFATTPSHTTLTGTARMQQRPIRILVDALRALGAEIGYEKEEGFPPITITGKTLDGGTINLPGSVSSQYISALLMVAPTMRNGLSLNITGEIISKPYINITLGLMRRFGICIEQPDDHTINVKPGCYSSGDYIIENDWSAASYWYEVLALASEGEITLEGLFADSLQGDKCISRLFEPLGVCTSFVDGNALLTKRQTTNSDRQRYEADLTDSPDLAQTIIATCCGIGLPFRISGLQSLRIKETDRLLALQQELAKLGFSLHEHEGSILEWDGTRSTPQPFPDIDTYQDHRMAMCLAPLCMVCGKMRINDAQVVSKSYPTFWNDMELAGFCLQNSNI